MDDDQQFCLRWNNHQSTLISVFDTLLENETLVDCTLAAEGKFLKAHKVVLSACSPYFATLLQEQYDKHPIFILKDVKYQELRAMMDYMYRGEVNISQDQLAALLKAAESLQIKGLSDNRSGAPKPEHHRGLNVPGSSGSGKLSAGYTLEQTQSKRARIGPSSMESQDMSGSREGSSSPSRRRRKVRRRSIENAMADVHDNSNSSQIQTNQSSLLQQQQQQSNASLAGVGAITAAASALASQLPVSAATLPTGSSSVAAAAAAAALASTQGTTTSVTKKTESVKGTSDAMNTENVQSGGGAIGADDQSMEHVKGDKQNHKQKSSTSAAGAAGKEQAELVIEPKSEYDEEGNEETVEDLTLDDEEMGMEDLDQNAGTSQGGEGSSQGYAPWQHDRSQDELLLATQEAQQRDPQDLSRKLAQLHKENTAPLGVLIQKSCQRSILNTTNSTKRARSRNSLQSTDAITQSKLLSQQQQQQQQEQQQQQQQQEQQQQQITTVSTANQLNGNRKRMSMSDVSDMLFELYRAKAPKNLQEVPAKFGQTSPVSAETQDPSSTAAIANNSAAAIAAACVTAAASKNLQGDEMMSMPVAANVGNINSSSSSNNSNINTHNSNGTAIAMSNAATSFHPRIKYITKQLITEGGQIAVGTELKPEPTRTAIPTSVLVMPTSPQIDIKPVINPVTGLVMSASTSSSAASVIKTVPTAIAAVPGGSNVVPPAAAIAAVLLRDGYHTFQQQLHAQELLKQQSRVQLSTADVTDAGNATTSTKLLENFLRQQREQRNVESNDAASDTNDGDDEDDSRYNGFDDIHLVESTKHNQDNVTLPNLFQSGPSTSSPASFTAAAAAAGDYLSDESQKYMIAAQAQALRNFEFSLGDYGGAGVAHAGNAHSVGVGGGNTSPNGGIDGEPVYECRHCGKKYRWKSTLRRHENVECGGKEPSHQCPYCPYKSKQRGNLGVHVRKHHSNLPQLASKRRSKYSRKLESANSSVNNTSDDSTSKLVIDCSK